MLPRTIPLMICSTSTALPLRPYRPADDSPPSCGHTSYPLQVYAPNSEQPRPECTFINPDLRPLMVTMVRIFRTPGQRIPGREHCHIRNPIDKFGDRCRT